MSKTDPATLPLTKAGLVACTINVSEAGLGLRKGEVRGLSADVAATMIDKGSAALHKPTKAAKPDVSTPTGA